MPSSQLGIVDNSEDQIYSEDLEEKDDPNDETYSPGITSDSMKSSESCSEQSLEITNVRIYLDFHFSHSETFLFKLRYNCNYGLLHPISYFVCVGFHYEYFKEYNKESCTLRLSWFLNWWCLFFKMLYKNHNTVA